MLIHEEISIHQAISVFPLDKQKDLSGWGKSVVIKRTLEKFTEKYFRVKAILWSFLGVYTRFIYETKHQLQFPEQSEYNLEKK